MFFQKSEGRMAQRLLLKQVRYPAVTTANWVKKSKKASKLYAKEKGGIHA